ncbi:MAG: outer membrane lipoprotein-sorting protein [Prolixibacteraceae bacterium]|jgi:outer membrane lipoprotein-sorting protein|nr:outer membrane lipoprotein-sorting protein [Prolixibacteraceae bacterium]
MKTLIFLLLSIISLAVLGQNGSEWIERFEKQMKISDQEVALTMQLVSKNGIKRERKLQWNTMENNEGLESSYIVFDAPADIAGTAFLSVESSNNSEDQWLYLPALKRSRRISSNEKSNSFMGSDFSYSDIGNENTDNSSYELLKTVNENGKELKVIEAIYKEQSKIKETGYAKRIIYIDASNSMMVKTDFFDTKDKLAKQLVCSDFKAIAGSNKVRAHRYEMKNLQKGTSTVLLFSNYHIDKGIDPDIFTIRNLEKN